MSTPITLNYRRWDETILELNMSIPENDSVYHVNSATPIHIEYEVGQRGLSYADLSSHNDGTRLLLNLQGNTYSIDAASFYEKVEGVGDDAILVSNIDDYMKVIGFYRFIAVLVKTQRVLSDCLNKCSNEAKDDMARVDAIYVWEKYWKPLHSFTSHLENLAMKKLREAIKKKDYSQLDVSKLEDSFINKTKDAISYGKKCKPAERYDHRSTYETAVQIDRIITLYQEDEVFMHYRGVGKIIYPEFPSVFRNKRKYEEERLYKEMKIAFPEELGHLRYLDRLAKCQHFELPTRMLDVTSNPLVALYMACNKIYTGDPEQVDYGEIVIYFSGDQKERAYDSKALLMVAALVKLTYQEKTDMYKFIRMHQQYIDDNRKPYQRNTEQIAMWKLLNSCVHLANDYDSDSPLPMHYQQNLTNLLNDAGISTLSLSANTPFEFCWACMQGITRPKNDSNWRCVDVDPKVHFSSVVTKDDYHTLFHRFIEAYDRLLVTIRRENTAFQNKIDIATLLLSFHGRFGMTNERIIAQSGSFIIAGLDHRYINDQMLSTRTQIDTKRAGGPKSNKVSRFARIIICNKKDIFRQLKLLNISNATMLPDMTHKAQDLKTQLDRW